MTLSFHDKSASSTLVKDIKWGIWSIAKLGKAFDFEAKI